MFHRHKVVSKGILWSKHAFWLKDGYLTHTTSDMLKFNEISTTRIDKASKISVVNLLKSKTKSLAQDFN